MGLLEIIANCIFLGLGALLIIALITLASVSAYDIMLDIKNEKDNKNGK